MSIVNVRIEPDGGEPYEVPIVARDVLVWEKTTHGASVGQLERNQRMQDIYALAHIAARRLGRFTGSRDEFEATCDVELAATKAGESDPTHPAL